jgi:uncharacterized membrane protein
MQKIWNTMLKGLVAILPIGLTLYLVYWLALAAERFVSPVIRLVLPESFYWPGLGLLAGLLLLYLAGLAVNAYVIRNLLGVGDQLLERIPLVKTIYVATRDFMQFFPAAGRSSDLKRVVLVPLGPGKIIGFVTAENASLLGPGARDGTLVAVYLPMSYMVGGYTLFLPRSAIEPTSLTVEAGMRLALMGGVQGAPGAGASSDTAR